MTPHSPQARERAKTPRRRRSYDESLDEPGKLISEETVDVETEAPAEENESVERPEPENTPDPPAFEEDETSD